MTWKISRVCLRVLYFFLLIFNSKTLHGTVFTLPTLETSQTEAIFKTLGSSFAFRPVESASDLGIIWGIYLGAGLGGTETSKLTAVSSDAPTYLPSAELQFGLGLPLGFTIETGLMPSISYQGTSISKYGGALKWTATRTVLRSLPVSLAARLAYSKGTINWSQPLNSGAVTIDYKNEIIQSQIAASKMFGTLGLGLEPYVGLGFISHTSQITGSGSANLFGASFSPGTTSVSGKNSSLWGQAGLMVHLVFLAISAEYDNMFGINSYSAKLTLRM